MEHMFRMPCWKCSESEAAFTFNLETGTVYCVQCEHVESLDWISNLVVRWEVVLRGFKAMYTAILAAKNPSLDQMEDDHEG